MSDTNSAQPLDGGDTAALLFSMEELKRKTEELHASLPDSAVKGNLALHVLCILSASGKIEANPQLDSRFSQNELRVMYIAVCELRETVQAVLDAHASSAEARQKSFAHLKECNGLLRKLKAEMQRNGYEMDEALAAAYT